jgi:hypothetical protein
MSLFFFAKSAGAVLGLTYVEHQYGPNDSSLFAVTPAILTGIGFWALTFGSFKVGEARTKYKKLAEKNGELNVEERYSLPNLYVDGNTKAARAFNCAQRAHQHIFETLSCVMLTGVMGAMQYPITTAITTLMYAVGRIQMSNAYYNSEGDASKRYEPTLAWFMWYGVIMNCMLSFLSCANMVAGGKLLW